jgi:hypothetical protein
MLRHSVPLLAAFHAWMIEQLAKVDQGSTWAAAFDYAFNNWDALQRYTEDGHLESTTTSQSEASVEPVSRGNQLGRGASIKMAKDHAASGSCR